MTESQKLLNFGFQAYERRLLYKKNVAVGTPEIFKGTRPLPARGLATTCGSSLPARPLCGPAGLLETKQPFVAPYAAGEKRG
jgi:D-alanyl-D-alanine carboxypeptidase (penicillin-binding protein 5/6)